MQYTPANLYIEDSHLVISLRDKEVQPLLQRFRIEYYVSDEAYTHDLYNEEEQDRHSFDDIYEDDNKRYAIYLSRDKQETSIKRITPFYQIIDNWNIHTRCKNNAKRLLQKLETIINHGFYAELQSDHTMVCYINIGKGVVLSVDKQLFSFDLKVVYSIRYKNKVLRVNSCDIDTLINNIIQLQKKLKFIA